MQITEARTTGDWRLHVIIINSELLHPPYTDNIEGEPQFLK